MSKLKNKRSGQPFTTTHNLVFEVAPWPRSTEFMVYRVGTCNGTWRATPTTYDILNIVNADPGNGHFEDVLQWFYRSCRRDYKDLRFLEVANVKFFRHLIEKRGFTAQGDHCIKKFTMTVHKLLPKTKDSRAGLNSTEESRAYPEGTAMFDTYHEFTFLFVCARDNWDDHCHPGRFRIATEEDLRKYPLG